MILLRQFSRKELNVFAVIRQSHSLPLHTDSRPLFAFTIPRNTRFSFRMASNLPKNALFSALINHDEHSIAIAHSASCQKHTYGQLVRDVAWGRGWLNNKIEQMQIKSRCVAFLIDNGYEYVGAQNSSFFILVCAASFVLHLSKFGGSYLNLYNSDAFVDNCKRCDCGATGSFIPN